ADVAADVGAVARAVAPGGGAVRVAAGVHEAVPPVGGGAGGDHAGRAQDAGEDAKTRLDHRAPHLGVPMGLVPTATVPPVAIHWKLSTSVLVSSTPSPESYTAQRMVMISPPCTGALVESQPVEPWSWPNAVSWPKPVPTRPESPSEQVNVLPPAKQGGPMPWQP